MRTRTAITTVAAALALAACEERISLVPTGGDSPAAPAPAEHANPPPAPATAPSAPSPPASPAAAPGGPSASPSPTETAPPGATPAPAPSPAIPSAKKLLRAAIAIEPTGVELPLSPDEETVVDPAATFRLELAGATPDARLVLLDKHDAIVPSKGSRELGATTAFSLAPAEPLVPASRYLLRVDGARTRELHDAGGTAYAPFTFALLVAGEPPPPEPKPAPKKKRGRR